MTARKTVKTAEEKRWGWQKWTALLLPVFLTVAIPAGPQYLTWFNQWRFGVGADQVEDAERMYQLSMRNISCLRKADPAVMVLKDGRTMLLTGCPSGDVLRTFMGPHPTSPRIDAWFGAEERLGNTTRSKVRDTLENPPVVLLSSLEAEEAEEPSHHPKRRLCIKDYPEQGLLREVWVYEDGRCYLYERYYHEMRNTIRQCTCSEGLC